MKSAQTGLTERMVTEAMWLPDMYSENSLYLFPTSTGMSDLVQERIDEPLNNNKYLLEVSGRAKRLFGKQADKVGLKRMSKGFVYFRGSNKATQITSVPADAIFADELDRMLQSNVPFFSKRLANSERKWKRWASTPTIPNFGIHKKFLNSTQQHFLIKCNGCGDWQDLTFENNVKYEMKNDKVCLWAKLVCSKCGKDIIPWESEGQWVAKEPDNRVVGYFISKLYSPRVDLIEMVESSRKTSEWDIQQFYNQDLGLPYLGKGGNITDEIINSCVRDYKLGDVSKENFMGVDVGRRLHVIIQNNEDKIVAIKAVESFSELDQLMVTYNVKQCVVDALPETRKSQEFANRFKGRVKLCYYSGLTEVKEDEWFKVDEQKVNTDRTLSLDMWTDRFKNQKIALPVNIEDYAEFLSHMKSTSRVINKNERTGKMVAQYIETGDDHYYHAGNYSNIAKAIFDKVVEPEIFVI